MLLESVLWKITKKCGRLGNINTIIYLKLCLNLIKTAMYSVLVCDQGSSLYFRFFSVNYSYYLGLVNSVRFLVLFQLAREYVYSFFACFIVLCWQSYSLLMLTMSMTMNV